MSVLISAERVYVDEASGFAEVLVRLNAPSNLTVSVDYETTEASAFFNAQDFGSAKGTLSFAAGETVKTVLIPIIDNAVGEGLELFRFNLLNAVNGKVVTESTEVVIVDDDAPAVLDPVISVRDVVVDEASGRATFVIALDHSSNSVVSANFSTLAGTAGAADFTAATGSVVFQAGEVMKLVTIDLANDAVSELDERFQLVLSNVNGATLPADGAGTAFIAANDKPAVATPLISSERVYVDEASGFAEVVVRLSAPSNLTVSVDYETTEASAFFNVQDFGSAKGTLSFAAGETVKTVLIPIIDNAVGEGLELFRFNLLNAVNGKVVTESTEVVIVDDDAPAVLDPVISVRDVVVDEASGRATFVIALDHSSNSVVSANFSTLAGTAGAADFTAATGSVVFQAGEVMKLVTIDLANDAVSELDERFQLVLSNVNGATLPADGAGTAFIAANDKPAVATPLISSERVYVDEASGFAEVVVRLSAPSNLTVSVDYETTEASAFFNVQDFGFAKGTLSFAAGETVKTVLIPIIDNAVGEGLELFRFNLLNAVNGKVVTESTEVVIVDDDAPAVLDPVISVRDVVVDEASGRATFVIALDHSSNSVVSANFSTLAGTAGAADFTAATGSVVFQAGEVMKLVTIDLANDAVSELDERFQLVLSNVSGATLPADGAGTAFIAANDKPAVATPLISSERVYVDEASGFAEVVVRLSAPSNLTVSVDYETTEASAFFNVQDFGFAKGTLSFAAGETVKTVLIPIIDNAVGEGLELFRFNLLNAVNGKVVTESTEVVIVDDDAPAVLDPVISVRDVVVDEASGRATFVIALDHSSNSVVSANFFTLAGTAGAADFTAATGSVVFQAGEVMKLVTIDLANDAVSELDERFQLVLSNVSGATLPADGAGTAFIAANDKPAVATPLISSERVYVDEASGFAEVVVRLSAPSNLTVSVDYETTEASAFFNAQDFGFAKGTLSFAAGETVKTVLIPIIDNAVGEGLELFHFNLLNAVNGTVAQARSDVVIVDNDSVGRYIVGQLGDDVFTISTAGVRIYETTYGGMDTVRTSLTSYTLGVNIENLLKTGVSGISGIGNGLANMLTGNNGKDSLSGLDGNDRLDGGRGNDVLTGGLGKDQFVFTKSLGPGNADTITDFSAADDTFALDDAVFTGLSVGRLSGAEFRANLSGKARDSTDRIIYETDTGKVWFDSDGNGIQGRALFAVVLPQLSLTNADFLVF